VRAGPDGPKQLPEEVRYPMLALDSVLYSFLPLFFSMILRVVQRRDLLVTLYIYSVLNTCMHA